MAFQKILRKAAWTTTAIGLVSMLCGGGTGVDELVMIGGLLFFLGLFLALIFGLLSAPNAARVINWCMALYVVGMLLKFLRYPGASMTLIPAFWVPIALFLVHTVSLPFRYKGRLFLILAGGAAGLVLAVGYWATLSKMMYWPLSDLLFSWFAPGYVVITIVLLVGIQLTDFVAWAPEQRRYLINNIMVPWAFLFIVGGALLLLPEQYFDLMGSKADWGMVANPDDL